MPPAGEFPCISSRTNPGPRRFPPGEPSRLRRPYRSGKISKTGEPDELRRLTTFNSVSRDASRSSNEPEPISPNEPEDAATKSPNEPEDGGVGRSDSTSPHPRTNPNGSAGPSPGVIITERTGRWTIRQNWRMTCIPRTNRSPLTRSPRTNWSNVVRHRPGSRDSPNEPKDGGFAQYEMFHALPERTGRGRAWTRTNRRGAVITAKGKAGRRGGGPAGPAADAPGTGATPAGGVDPVARSGGTIGATDLHPAGASAPGFGVGGRGLVGVDEAVAVAVEAVELRRGGRGTRGGRRRRRWLRSIRRNQDGPAAGVGDRGRRRGRGRRTRRMPTAGEPGPGRW